MIGHPVALLGAAVLLSLPGIAPAGATAATSGRVSAHLTKTTFTAAEAAKVRLVLRVTRAGTRVSLVLSRRQGTTWLKLRSLSQRPPSRATRSLTVRWLFGGATVAAASYRLRVSTPANGLTLRFTVTRRPAGATTQAPGAFAKTAPGNGATGQSVTPSLAWQASSGATGYRYCVDTTPDNACDGSFTSTGTQTTASPAGLAMGATYYWQVEATNADGVTPADGGTWHSFTVGGPQAGGWRSTSLEGPTGYFVPISSVSFTVTAAGVADFTFAYSWSTPTSPVGGTCSGSDASYPKTSAAPITGASFTSSSLPWPSGLKVWAGIGSGEFSGTFDSPTTAHGTASLAWTLGTRCNPSSGTSGPFTWTAAWQAP